jgi:hypothetical protein
LPVIPARFSGVLFSLWAAVFWASAPIGIVLGATLTHRFLGKRKGQPNGDGHAPPGWRDRPVRSDVTGERRWVPDRVLRRESPGNSHGNLATPRLRCDKKIEILLLVRY